MTQNLTVACLEYDTTRALFDGTVVPRGFDATMRTAATIPDIFEPMVREHRFDVSELGWTYYLRTLEAGAPFVAVPAFPNRVFRHSCVFVNAHSGIREPADLAGRTVGEFGIYGQDSGVWAKGILSDEYGFRPETCRWVIGGLDRPAPPFDFVPQPHPAGVEVTAAPPDRSLGAMLEAGEIDALFTANVPQCVLDGSPHVTRLFDDHVTVERDWFRRTGIFPIMHTVVLPRERAASRPGLTRDVYDAFLAAKEAAADAYRAHRRLYQVQTMIPWMNDLVDRDLDLMPGDWWPYGVAANRDAVDAVLRYHHEQGITTRRWTPAEVFAPELLDT